MPRLQNHGGGRAAERYLKSMKTCSRRQPGSGLSRERRRGIVWSEVEAGGQGSWSCQVLYGTQKITKGPKAEGWVGKERYSIYAFSCVVPKKKEKSGNPKIIKI